MVVNIIFGWGIQLHDTLPGSPFVTSPKNASKWSIVAWLSLKMPILSQVMPHTWRWCQEPYLEEPYVPEETQSDAQVISSKGSTMYPYPRAILQDFTVSVTHQYFTYGHSWPIRPHTYNIWSRESLCCYACWGGFVWLSQWWNWWPWCKYLDTAISSHAYTQECWFHFPWLSTDFMGVTKEQGGCRQTFCTMAVSCRMGTHTMVEHVPIVTMKHWWLP